MKYVVHIVPSAERQFLRLQSALQNRVKKKIFSLESNPRSSGSQKLHGTQFNQVRVGDYRIIYEVDDSCKIITILDLVHRREVYRKW